MFLGMFGLFFIVGPWARKLTYSKSLHVPTGAFPVRKVIPTWTVKKSEKILNFSPYLTKMAKEAALKS